MQINTARDLGALIKDRRRALNLTQQDLAARVGVRRLWIVELEKGKPRAQISLVLRTLKELGVAIHVSIKPITHTNHADVIDLDAIIQKSKATK
jgi:HTH-type transcriptional regulator / antitoxin HipB